MEQNNEFENNPMFILPEDEMDTSLEVIKSIITLLINGQEGMTFRSLMASLTYVYIYCVNGMIYNTTGTVCDFNQIPAFFEYVYNGLSVKGVLHELAKKHERSNEIDSLLKDIFNNNN